MRIFSDFDVYKRQYTYDEMKVMCVIGELGGTVSDNLDYEDLCRIVEAVYAHWVDGWSADEDEKYQKYPWLEFETNEEDWYIQVYAYRVLPEFIQLYKEEYLYKETK